MININPIESIFPEIFNLPLYSKNKLIDKNIKNNEITGKFSYFDSIIFLINKKIIANNAKKMITINTLIFEIKISESVFAFFRKRLNIFFISLKLFKIFV